MKEKSRHSWIKENEENLSPADLPKRMTKGSSLNRKETIKEGILLHQKGR